MGARRLLSAASAITTRGRVTLSSTKVRSPRSSSTSYVRLRHDEAVVSAVDEDSRRNVDLPNAWHVLQEIIRVGVPPRGKATADLLEHAPPSPALENVPNSVKAPTQATKKIPPTPMTMVSKVWESRIRKTLARREGGSALAIERALAVYNSSLEKNVKPTSAMAIPILEVLCPRENLNSDHVDQALAIYRGLAEAIPANSPTARIEHWIYKLVLRAVVETRRYKDIEAMIKDIVKQNVRFNGGDVLYYIRTLIQATDTHEEAFKCYLQLRTIAPPDLCYATAINSMIQKRRDVSQFPLARHILAMLAHAKESMAVKLDSNTMLSILLRRYCWTIYYWIKYKKRQVLHPSLRHAMRSEVAQVHQYIQVEHDQPPNAQVWGALMNAYSFTDQLEECLKIWAKLREEGAVGVRHVSIMMDACAQSRRCEVADEIFDQLRRENFPLDRIAWESYVECLGSFGAQGLERAVQVVTNEMGDSGKEGGSVPAATLNTLRVILVHAWRHGRFSKTISQIKRELPNLYAQMVHRALVKQGYDPDNPPPEPFTPTPTQLYQALPRKERTESDYSNIESHR